MNGSDEASTIIIDEDLSDSACLERNEKVLQDMRDKWAVMSQLKLETSRESSASTMKIFGGVGGGAYRMAIQQQSNPEDINRSRTKQKSPNPGTNKSKSHSVATENMKSIKSSVGNADDTDSSDIRASLGEGLRAILDDPNNAALGMYAGYYRGIPVLFNSDGTVVDISLKKLASSSTRVVASASSSAPTTTGNRRGGYKNINQSKTKGRASDDQSRTNQPHSREKSDDGGHNVDALDFGSIIGIKRRGRPPKSQKVRTLTHPNGGVSGYEIDDNAGSNSGSYTDNNSACNSDNIGDHNSTDDQETFVNQSRSRRNESNSFGAK